MVVGTPTAAAEALLDALRTVVVAVEEVVVCKPGAAVLYAAINEKIKANIRLHGYKTPTPIQDQAIPHLLTGRDLSGQAATGTGKTAAFLIPIINKILLTKGQRALIILPTRELALQIYEESRKFTLNTNIFSTICIGGANIGRQIYSLSRRPDIVIGTPGRLKDLGKRNNISFATFNIVVLDEVDRMLDMGFVEDIKNILAQLPKVKQSMFFSATMPAEAERIMQMLLVNPVKVSVQNVRSGANVDQNIVRVGIRPKTDVLFELLIQEGFDRVMVFGKTKMGVERVQRDLRSRGISVASLHGDKSQYQRKMALDEFKQRKEKGLVATDVAARGLDIEDVTHVINYDLPESFDDYLHRIGRTGRANKKGVALSFVN